MKRDYVSLAGFFAMMLAASCGGDKEMNTDGGPSGADGDTATAPASCAEVDRAQEAPLLEGGTPEDQTLSGVYRVSERVIWDDLNTVTIEPGTIFLMEPDSHVIFGWRSDETTVFANGTASEPILFCGTQESAGHWQMVEFASGITTDSELHHVRIEDGGGMDVDAALFLYHPILLDSVTVRNSAAAGLYAGGLDADSADLTLTESAYPALLEGPETVTNLPAGAYTGNTEDAIHLRQHHTGSITLHDRGVPYLQLEERVGFNADNSVVTFEAGVEYRFSQDSFMSIGSVPTTVFVEGTAGDPVVFTSHRDGDGAQPGDWDGLYLSNDTTSDSSIEHAEFRFGGKASALDGECPNYNCGNLVVGSASFSVSDTAFTSSAGYGVAITDARDSVINGNADPAAGVKSMGNTFPDNAEGDAHVYFP